ncbi:LysR family substrate-binding domain-containing protein [Microbacterium sp.]|uniref:LysR family substrate-binding domain-containing protein n=1 Tax=Microbacterium sp. TaxID=51671 RepID=UPI003A8896DB
MAPRDDNSPRRHPRRARRQPTKRRDAPNRPPDPAAPPPLPPTPFRLGVVPGVTPGKWIDTWRDRYRATPLDLVALTVADQERAVRAGEVDAAVVRLPIDRDGLHVIALYDELPVVVCAADSVLTAATELRASDLVGETLIVPLDDVLHCAVPGTVSPVFPPPPTTADAMAIIATGVGIATVPMSLARLHHRKDTAFRPLAEGPVSTVALTWLVDGGTPAVEAFIGIVRGRTARSSRT